MKKYFLILAISFFCSCYNRKHVFNTFDITFTDGWAENFSFKTDSEGNYFVESSKISGFSGKGKVPDSVLVRFDELAEQIQNKVVRDSIGIGCVDCPKVSIVVNSEKGELLLNQMYFVDDNIGELVSSLSRFIFEAKHEKADSLISFKSKFVAPKPWIDPVKFVIPK